MLRYRRNFPAFKPEPMLNPTTRNLNGSAPMESRCARIHYDSPLAVHLFKD